MSFKRLARRYLESLIGLLKYNFHYTAMHRSFIPFFGSYDDITKITAGALSDYLIWRRQKSGNKILPQSLNKENVAFNQMMRLAQEHEWIKVLKIVTWLAAIVALMVALMKSGVSGDGKHPNTELHYYLLAISKTWIIRENFTL